LAPQHRDAVIGDMAMSGFSNFLHDVARRGVALASQMRGAAAAPEREPVEALVEGCEALLTGRGEASGAAMAQDVLARWQALDRDARRRFLEVLGERFGPDQARLDAALDVYRKNPDPLATTRLHEAAEPRRQELIRRLNLASGGTKALVDMREELLRHRGATPALKAVDADFFHLFSSWFNRGFLALHRIDWATPASILEKIIRYEAIHAINDWDELRRRMEPTDRRCFGFFHPQLADEPLIFVEVALTTEVPDNIAALLTPNRAPIPAASATTAVFYSLSKCHKGLAGVSFGNFLIKQVVEDLRRELPNLSTFVTLSPVPGFAAWLDRERKSDSAVLSARDRHALIGLDVPGWQDAPATAEALRATMLRAAAHYFLTARTPSGDVVDAVARFHLGNGARLERLNYLADRSANGMRQSYSLMVNYLYELDDIEANHETFVSRNEVVTTDRVRRLLADDGEESPSGFRALTQRLMRPKARNHLFDLFRSRIAGRQRPFIETADGRLFSYQDALDLSARLAHALVSLGVGPGDRVAVQVEKSPEAIVLYLACLRAGAVYLPLNTGYTLTELEYFIADAEPRLVVCAESAAKALEPIAAKHGGSVATLGAMGDGTLLDAARDQPTEFAEVARAPEDLAAILYTSGTTGRCKGAMLSHDNLGSNAAALAGYWRFSAADVLLHALPIFHTHGLFVATNVTLMAGASMLFLPKFDPDEIMRLMPRATVMMGVPTFYVRLLQHPRLTREAAAHVRLFISGSAPLLAETHVEWERRTAHRILERYGMTETNMNTSNPYDGVRKAGTVGFPLPGVSVRITDPATGAPLPNGAVGMIEVKGPNVFRGYWRMPEKTRAEFRADGFFITGDLGKIDSDGYVSIVGRDKDMIISGGLNVYPKEVEEAIDGLPGVVESAVFGVPHPDFGEGVSAAVVRAPGATIDEGVIHQALATKLARFKQPKRVVFVDELPRNTMGKVQKNVLRDVHADLYAVKEPAG
jgi:acyl-CoA synthetase (AMP-forming)/AMP-acid ligase II